MKFSIMILLVFLPLVGIAGILFLLAGKFWYVPAGVLIFLLTLYGIMRNEWEEQGNALQSRIWGDRGSRSRQRIELLQSIGQPECPVPTATGTAYVLSDRQQGLWDQYKQMEADNEALTKREDDAMIEMGI